MNAFELFATITLNDEEYKQKLNGAGKETKSFGQKVGSVLKGAGKAFVGMAAATTAVVGTFVGLTSQTAAYGDNIDKMSQKMNMTTDAYQEWDFVMQHCGTSIESMQASMKTLANAAETGNAAFEQLGISQEQIASMSQADLFNATITALQNVSSETERTYLAGKLLGRGATELGALLNMSASETEAMRQQVHDLGGVMSVDAIKAAASFQDSLQNLKTGFAGAKYSLMAEFFPSITTVMDGLTALFSGDESGGLAMVNSGVNDFVSTLSNAVPKVVEFGSSVLNGIVSAISENLPTLVKAAAQIVSELASALVSLAPSLMESAVSLVTMLANGLASNAPLIIEGAMGVIMALSEGLAANAGQIGESAGQLVAALVVGIITNIPALVEAAINIVSAFGTAIISAAAGIAEAAAELVAPLLARAGQLASDLWSRAVAAVTNFAKGIRDKVSEAVAAAGEVLSNVVSTIAALPGELWDMAITAITDFANGVRNKVSDAMSAAAEVASSVVSAVSSLPGSLLSTATSAVTNFVTGIQNKIASVASAAGEIVSSVSGAIAALPGQALTWGVDLLANFISGIKSKIADLVGTISGIAGKIKSLLGFSEPEEGPLSNFHTYAPDMMDLFMKGIKDNERKLQNQIASTFDFGDMVTGAPLPSVAASGTSGTAYGGVVNIYPQQMDEATVDYLVGRVQRELGWVLA